MYINFESRVLFKDEVNGKGFNFAIVYGTHNRSRAIDLALEEFPNASIVEVTHVRSKK